MAHTNGRDQPPDSPGRLKQSGNGLQTGRSESERDDFHRHGHGDVCQTGTRVGNAFMDLTRTQDRCSRTPDQRPPSPLPQPNGSALDQPERPLLMDMAGKPMSRSQAKAPCDRSHRIILQAS
jgi:hypothetical protein